MKTYSLFQVAMGLAIVLAAVPAGAQSAAVGGTVRSLDRWVEGLRRAAARGPHALQDELLRIDPRYVQRMGTAARAFRDDATPAGQVGTPDRVEVFRGQLDSDPEAEAVVQVVHTTGPVAANQRNETYWIGFFDARPRGAMQLVGALDRTLRFCTLDPRSTGGVVLGFGGHGAPSPDGLWVQEQTSFACSSHVRLRHERSRFWLEQGRLSWSRPDAGELLSLDLSGPMASAAPPAPADGSK